MSGKISEEGDGFDGGDIHGNGIENIDIYQQQHI